jgi:large subunit ribosomal protein L35
MSKMKSHKGLLKRIRLTAKKKIKFPQHGKRHINSHFTGSQVRKLRGRKKCAKGADMRRLEKMMHMRLNPSDRVRGCFAPCTGCCETAAA